MRETLNPQRTAPIAILTVLLLTIAIYVLLALVAVALPDRSITTESDAPMAALYEEVSGRDSAPIAVTLIVLFPLVALARLTSLVTLLVFTMVNISLFLMGRRSTTPTMARFRWVGLGGAVLSLALALWQIADAVI